MKDIDEIRRENIKTLVEKFGSVTALAKILDMSDSQLSNLKDGGRDAKTGKRRGMRKDTARRIEAGTKKPKGWLDVDHSEFANIEPAVIGGYRIPLISKIQAGVWIEIIDNFQLGDAEEWLLTDLKHSASTFALTISDESMMPEFKLGDRVIIDPEVLPRPGSFVAAKNIKKEAIFKKYRLRGIDENSNYIYELIPLNEDYPTIRSDREPCSIIGTMVEHRRYFR